MMIDGTVYLLATTPAGHEEVVRYTENDMAEVFSDHERKDLERGGEVVHATRFGELIRFVDMIAAARAVQ